MLADEDAQAGAELSRREQEYPEQQREEEHLDLKGTPPGATEDSRDVSGARNEQQLRENIGATGWTLTVDQMAALDVASAVTAAYPYFPYQRQEGFARLSPPAA